MNKNIVLKPINKLRPHEAINQKRLGRLLRKIKVEGCLRKPVVVDRETLTVLDGHHRLAALKKLGCQKIPVFLIDYGSNQVKVYLRRKNLTMRILKELVLIKANKRETFPSKTTRHYLPARPRIKVALAKLLPNRL